MRINVVEYKNLFSLHKKFVGRAYRDFKVICRLNVTKESLAQNTDDKKIKELFIGDKKEFDFVFETQFHLKQFYDLTKKVKNHITFEFVKDIQSVYELSKEDKQKLFEDKPIIT